MKKLNTIAVLICGLINCSAYAAVDSFWKTKQIHHQVNFTSLVDENLFTALRLFEVENDIPKNKHAINTLESIFNVKYHNSGNFKLALANLVRHEHNLARVTVGQITQTGIDKSNKQTYYPDLLKGFDSANAKYEYSALINRRGTLINVPHQFVEMANFGCIDESVAKYEMFTPSDVHTPVQNICTQDNINAQIFISTSPKQIISAGKILIVNKKTKEKYKIDVIIAIDTSDILCEDNPTCVSTHFTLKDAFKSLDYKDDYKMEVGINLIRQQDEEEYNINELNLLLPALSK